MLDIYSIIIIIIELSLSLLLLLENLTTKELIEPLLSLQFLSVFTITKRSIETSIQERKRSFIIIHSKTVIMKTPCPTCKSPVIIYKISPVDQFTWQNLTIVKLIVMHSKRRQVKKISCYCYAGYFGCYLINTNLRQN